MKREESLDSLWMELEAYGLKAILRAVSYTPEGTALYIVGLTGGHKP